jgi:hypothetical protein
MGGALRGSAADGLQREYVALPPQGVTIGPLKLSNIPFFAPAGAKDISSTSDFGLRGSASPQAFSTRFISPAERFVILETR